MPFDVRRFLSFACLAILALGAGPLTSTAEAQYFGRNKVQYETFDFEVLETEHFDIYYYPSEREAVEQAARMAERWYARLSRVLNHELRGRQPLILYASHPDFQQTTALPGRIGEGTGGATEPLKRRIVLPLAGPLAETDHVIGHELVHAFQFDITTRSRSPMGGGQFPTALGLPLWFVEGMAEYLSAGPVDAHTSMWMREAALREKVPSLRQLNNPRFFPYRYGQALWAYVAGSWGDQVVGEALKRAGATGDPIQALTTILKVSPDSLSSGWQQAINEAYESLKESTKRPEDYGRALLTGANSGDINVGPSLSPDGTKLVFLSEKDLFAIEMFVADVETGEVERKIVKTALDPHWESLQFINSAGAWHPNGRDFVFGAISKGRAILSVVDTERGKITEEFKFRDVGEIFNPTYSPDGRYIVFSANAGGASDLFLLDTETNERRRLTQDLYADIQPAWSPDGEWIAFVTDRFTTDLKTLSIGDYRLARLDPETGAIESVPGFEDAKNINPQWGPDGSLYFLSDFNGITNVYRIPDGDGEPQQVTNLLVGVSGFTHLSPALTVATEANRAVYSVFEDNGFSLYLIDSEEVLRGDRPEPPLAAVSPAVLPPKDRPVGDVMALISNENFGLPDSAGAFQTKDYGAGLSLDYIAPPQFVVGADRFGTFVGGGSALFWSDMLGRHTLATMLQINGSFQDLAALVGYQNRSSRWNWGVVGAQVPFVQFGLVDIRADRGPNGEPVFVEEIIKFRQINREISGVIAYPFNRVHRMEFTGRFRNITFSSEIQRREFSQLTGQLLVDDDEDLPSCSDVSNTFLCDPDALNLGDVSAALVYDNAFFGGTSPILGQRYRFEVAPTFGTLNFVSALADFRRYFMPILPYTIAGRVLHLGRYGSGGEDVRRIQPLFVGYQQLIRGYNSGSFDLRECTGRASSSFVGLGNSGCPVFDQLFGSRVAVANLELRLPLFRGLGMSHPAGFPPLEVAFFFDAGVAWWTSGTAAQFGGNEDPFNPVTSHGIVLRTNLFGVGILELDFVHPNDRPEKGWIWQFGITPGF